MVYEDIELRFFTDVRLAMENKDFEWVQDEGGQWKKQYATKRTAVSPVKPKMDISETEIVTEPNNEVVATSPGLGDEVNNDSPRAGESTPETVNLDASMSWINSNSSLMSPVPKSGGKSANSIASLFSPGAGSVSSDDSLNSPKPDPDGLNLTGMNIDNAGAYIPLSPKRDP